MENKSHPSRVILLVLLEKYEAKIEAKVVKENTPLLLSKSSLKRYGAIIDTNDKATIFNKEIDLIFSSSGHYCVNIVPESCENVLILKFEPSTENKYR